MWRKEARFLMLLKVMKRRLGEGGRARAGEGVGERKAMREAARERKGGSPRGGSGKAQRCPCFCVRVVSWEETRGPGEGEAG